MLKPTKWKCGKCKSLNSLGANKCKVCNSWRGAKQFIYQ